MLLIITSGPGSIPTTQSISAPIASVVYMTYEGITNFSSLTNFYKKSIESLQTTCKEKITAIIDDPSAGITSELVVPGVNISPIAIFRLIVVVWAAKYYTFIGRTINATNIHYIQIYYQTLSFSEIPMSI